MEASFLSSSGWSVTRITWLEIMVGAIWLYRAVLPFLEKSRRCRSRWDEDEKHGSEINHSIRVGP